MQRTATTALVCASFLTVSGQAVTSEPQPDLADLHTLALEHDAELQAARHRRDAGMESLEQGRASLLPNMSISAEHSRQREWSDQPTGSGGFTEQWRETTSTRYQVSLTQPVFRLDAWYDYREGRAGARVADLEFEQRLQRFNRELLQAYLEALRAQVRVRTLESRVEAAEAQRQQASSRLDAGLSSRLDVSDAQAELKQAELELVRARSSRHAAMQDLTALTGQSFERVASIDDRFNPRQHHYPPLNNLLDSVRAQNARVRVLDAAAQRADMKRKGAMAEFAPDIDLTITANHEESEFEDAPAGGALGGDDAESVVVGLQLSMPLFTGGRNLSSYRQARAEKEEAYEQRRAAIIEARRAIEVSVRDLRSLREAVDAAEVSLEVEQERLSATQRAFKSGLRDTVDVVRAQRALFSARQEYEEARIDYVDALGRLREQTGSLDQAFLERVNGWLEASS